ncbi:helix-turn-helix domain-containing protein [Kribbella sandramycini]|uniref:Helix-turn-helix domain-containing protein n=1 Tax=Kribbella sandramycini TaxID=60450 RepID=A0A7Y4P0F2_9ACTN|nr:helix-turn-helix domain-containing protein [Kribbella sandramycini]MBB6569160.1 transcriptional regulator GlxA family with amidase domain [Kribbella sandramycini]NOL40999.1 helix-turn-helix domain-containing protein [Kribbella sandramycini]
MPSRHLAPVGPHQVAVLVLEPVVGFDLTIPSTVLGAATRADGTPLYEVRICGIDRAPVRVSHGFTLVPDHGTEILAEADTVIIPGTYLPEPRNDRTLPPAVADALATLRPGTRIASICTGAFVLAAAGLLNGRPVTTHWKRAELFRGLYPQVELQEERLFIDDGDIITSAGLAAGVDLCLHLIRRDFGSEIANRAARACVVPPWRDGGQSQFIEHKIPDEGSDGTAPTRAWALEHLAEELSLQCLAERARMSVRTFSRRFKAETGQSPGTWLLQQRVRHACHLLETTDLSVDRVAEAAGLGTAASLRHHLRSELGVSPLAYRKTFRAS